MTRRSPSTAAASSRSSHSSTETNSALRKHCFDKSYLCCSHVFTDARRHGLSPSSGRACPHCVSGIGTGTTGGTGASSKRHRRLCEELRDWVAGAADLCVCAIHGDFHSGNVLVRDTRIAGVVDWQYARLDWPALELAGVVWDLAWDGESPTIDVAVRDEIIRRYANAGGPGEPLFVRPLMRLESLVTALFSLTRAARGLPWNREFTRLVLATLDELA
jgi:Phosphotransferase enzyme family